MLLDKVCPNCQQPVEKMTPYLRVYVTDENGRENFMRMHIMCPAGAVMPGTESPNLAAGTGPQAMTGGGAVANGSPPPPPRQTAGSPPAAVALARGVKMLAPMVAAGAIGRVRRKRK
jgi:hypothetical protein